MMKILILFLGCILVGCHDSYPDRKIDSAAHKVVTCGSVIKLKNAVYGYRLHSHQINYATGSGQQTVTGYDGVDDINSLWVVKGPHKKECIQGTPIAKGDIIRLEHYATGKNLHSHLHVSPFTRQQEISGYGENDTGDTGDNWEVKVSADFWERDAEVKFQHSDTGKWLAMSSQNFGHPISNQKEVVGSLKFSNEAKWSAVEGFYFPITQPSF